MTIPLNRKALIPVLVAAVLVTAIVLWMRRSPEPMATKDPRSPYVGQEARPIKSLSSHDLQALEAGAGDALGGMATLAELNGYPGPRHVLDAARELGLSAEQREAVERIFRDMNQRAVTLGQRLIQDERELDAAFADGRISRESLERGVAESAQVYGDLRAAHLQAHLQTKDVLTADQVRRYNELRGYRTVDDPCGNVPPGHDPAMWRQHNAC